MSAAPTSIYLSHFAYQQIHTAVSSTGNLYETGGLLLGHRRHTHYFIVAITAPNETTDKSSTTFILDGDKHSQQAHAISQDFSNPPTVVGIWHSHIYQNLGFSLQDKISNRQMAHLLNGTLSLLIESSDTDNSYQHIAYFIDISGREFPCQIVSHTKNHFPESYLKTIPKGVDT